MREKIFFVSGTDTDVGKTVATGMMCRALAAAGRDWISVKAVQTGCEGFPEDLAAHRRIAGCGMFPEDAEGLTAPQVFKFPSSPLLAADLEGTAVDVDRIARCVDECARRREIVLVEGAGGLCVPLSADLLFADFAAARGWPLVLVASGKLGAINHALLSIEAARSRGMEIAAVLVNSFPETDPRLFADALSAVRRGLARAGADCPAIVLPLLGSGAAPDFSGIKGLLK